jgi:hypothetical protein
LNSDNLGHLYLSFTASPLPRVALDERQRTNDE